MSKPIRIQRRRVKGWKMPENTIYVGRPTKWGNPFTFKNGEMFLNGKYIGEGNQQGVVNMYERILTLDHSFNPEINELIERFANYDLTILKGYNLSCFCKEGSPCHADVLLRLANE